MFIGYPKERPNLDVDWKENWFMNAEDLSKLALQLNEMVSRFKL